MSNQVHENVPPQTLDARSLEAVAQLIQSGKAKRIVVLAGAGISTAAGIPDFRSPDTGLYANLERLNLPYAEAVFSIDFFRQDPKPFYVLAKELYPGQYQPTVSHAFLALLARKGLLTMLFTQNIDSLERAAGVPEDRIVEAHGSFSTQRCIDCRVAFTDAAAMRAHVQAARVPRCPRPGCGGFVKPNIVFFGESLPARFHSRCQVPATDSDLVLIIGTSLSVYPFAALATMPPAGVPRVLFNREAVGDLGTRPDDVLALSSCDFGVRKLADALGWREELETFWRGIVGDKEADRQIQEGPILAWPISPSTSDSDASDTDDDTDQKGDQKGDQNGDQKDDQKDGQKDDHHAEPKTETAGKDNDNANPDYPISSAEAEVSAITAKIEAMLRLEDAEDQEQASPERNASAEPSPKLQLVETAEKKPEVAQKPTEAKQGNDTTPPEELSGT